MARVNYELAGPWLVRLCLAYNITVNRLEKNAVVFVLVSMAVGIILMAGARFALHSKPLRKDLFPASETTYIKKLDLNAATREELETLPGIGPITAERIVELRQRKRGFTSLDQLLEVEGFGRKKLELLKPMLELGTGQGSEGSNH